MRRNNIFKQQSYLAYSSRLEKTASGAQKLKVKPKMKKYIARWFQDVDGRYLSLEESDKSVILIKAHDKLSATIIASEKEQEDAEIPFNNRVLVTEIK